VERAAGDGEVQVATSPLDAAALSRVLLRLPNWLGDVCFAAPTVAALHEASPRAELIAACRPSLAPLAALLPGVTQVVPLAPRGRAPLRTARTWRALGCDAAVVFPRSFRAALPVALARVPVRVGFASEARTLLLTHAVRGWKPLREAHRTAWFGALLAPFGLQAPRAPWRLEVPAAGLAWADAFLSAVPARRAGKPIVVLEPGGAYGTAKRWPEERYAALARALVTEGDADVVVIGSAEMVPLAERVAAAAGAPVLVAAGRTDLLGLAGLLARARLLVTNDTGPMHLAAAIGTPVVALFGSTDPAVCGPRGHGPLRVLYERVECSPCWLRTCPVPGHPCLDRFAVERVLEDVRALLAR
jgi:heptosyltransferase II